MYDGYSLFSCTDSCFCILHDSLHPEYTSKLQLEVKNLCVLRSTNELHKAVTICMVYHTALTWIRAVVGAIYMVYHTALTWIRIVVGATCMVYHIALNWIRTNHPDFPTCLLIKNQSLSPSPFSFGVWTPWHRYWDHGGQKSKCFKQNLLVNSNRHMPERVIYYALLLLCFAVKTMTSHN